MAGGGSEDPPVGRQPDASRDGHGRAATMAAPGALTEPVREPRRDWRRVARRSGSFLAAIFLFILAIQLMKRGAQAIGPRIEGTFPFDNGVSTLGLGWMGSYFVLSGSPVAASALSLFAGGALTKLQTFTMLAGSRLGASFIVLLVGFIYALKSRDRQTSIGMGVLALAMTAIVYVPGMLIGYAILKSGVLSGVDWHASGQITDLIDLVWGPLEGVARELLPAPLLFPAGLGIILISFKLLDQVLPSLDGERHAAARGHWLKRPWPMFLLGALAALLTLSVSVALTALVPLASRGFVKREEAIPYIAGANITTLADTLVVAMLQGGPAGAVGVQIVLAMAIAVTLVTLLYLWLLYGPISKGIITVDDWLVKSNRRLWLLVAALVVLPVLLMTSGFVIGPITR